MCYLIDIKYLFLTCSLQLHIGAVTKASLIIITSEINKDIIPMLVVRLNKTEHAFTIFHS